MTIQTSLRIFLRKERLIDIAANRVKRFVEHYDPQRLYVFYSGGKDSTAALAAVAYAGDSVVKRVVVVYNEIVGNTLQSAVKQSMRILGKLGFGNIATVDSPPYHRITHTILTARKLPLALYIRARSRLGLDFWGTVARYGLPIVAHSGQRYCYNEFKEKHWRALPAERGNKRFVVVGVKASDSRWRAQRWEGTGGVRVFPWQDGAKRYEDVALSPVYDMSSGEVWLLLREAGLDKLLETYRVYGDSMNCSFCPLRSLRKQLQIIEKLAESEEGRELLQRAREALKVCPKRPGTRTAELAQKWLEAIDKVLSR